MWKNPRFLFEDMTSGELKRMIYILVVSATEIPDIQVIPGDAAMEKAKAIFRRVYDRTHTKIKSLVKKTKLKRGQSLHKHCLEAINKEFFDQCLAVAQEIEKSKNYQFVTDMWATWYYGMQGINENIFSKRKVTTSTDYYFVFVQQAISLIHNMMGSESSTLVGTKSNIPVFLNHPMVARASDINRYVFPIDIQMSYIGKEDLSFLPKHDEFDLNAITYTDWPKVESTRALLDLLEDAYSNMRYMPHQDGSYVRIEGFPRVKGMLIKVFPSDSDPNGFGLMARIDLDSGSHLLVESDVSEKLSRMDVLPHAGSLGYGFFLWLACQVYHDLTTAKEVRVGFASDLEPVQEKTKSVARTETNYFSDYVPEWTCIPRVLKSVEQSVRIPIPMRQEYAPRHVRGYVRKGNMTDQHKKCIVNFEVETGLQILCRIRDGYTFVRPHVSPAITPEEWDGLPKYIKARIQDDLNSLLTTEQAK